jgi:hypothetical protein
MRECVVGDTSPRDGYKTPARSGSSCQPSNHGVSSIMGRIQIVPTQRTGALGRCIVLGRATLI